ncbi:MAG: hypothetical protein MSC30_15815 [Gaiellaceae bacterium MAG52_C11]|nr:hypothetical protein [Candidatus Gaiellasilicea maunaloa]
MRRLVCLLVLVVAGCGSAAEEPIPEARAAEPQTAQLDWREVYPERGRHLTFGVDRLEVTAAGWSAAVSIENGTGIPFALGKEPLQLAFGLMLFENGNLETLDEEARNGRLPPLREAIEIEPPPPAVLAPRQIWRATISAPGSLADDAYVRISFGTLVAEIEPPEGILPSIVWITDEAYRL